MQTSENTTITREIVPGINEAARTLGVPQWTLSRWVHGRRAADPAFVKPAAKLGITFPRVAETKRKPAKTERQKFCDERFNRIKSTNPET